MISSLLLLLAAPTSELADIVTRIPTRAPVVALTFDACQAGRTMHFDEGILRVLRAHPLPFTVFASGRFVRDNAAMIATLSKLPGVHIENHSWSHPADFRLLSDDDIVREVALADQEIERVTGRKPTLFRFPGGYADDRVVAVVGATGHRIVHWRWAEGDPARAIDAGQLVSQTNERTRPGDILILHINGRGWHTAEALPALIDGLESRGYQFVELESALEAPPTVATRESKKDR